MTFQWSGLRRAVILAVLTAGGLSDGVHRVRAADDPPTAAADDKKDEKSEPKNPSDLRNSIGNAAQVRSPATRPAPAKTGLWAELVDQPYYTPAVRAASFSSSANMRRRKAFTVNFSAAIRRVLIIPMAYSRRYYGKGTSRI